VVTLYLYSGEFRRAMDDLVDTLRVHVVWATRFERRYRSFPWSMRALIRLHIIRWPR
jgi:hypothetical protein